MIRLALAGCSNPVAYQRLASRSFSAEVLTAIDLDPPRPLTGSELRACDAVVIESRSAARAELALQAAAAGKHVLLAAPITRTTEEADRVIEACRRAGVCLMGAHRARFLPAAETIRASLAGGKLGELGLVRLHRWESRAGDVSLEGFPFEGAFDGVLDGIDLVRWLFGSSPRVVHAAGGELAGGSYLQIHFGFPGGGMALVDYAQALSEAQAYSSLSAIGSSGAAYADDHRDRHLLFRDGAATTLVSDQESRSLRGMIDEFVAAITGGREPAVTGADALDLLEVSLAVRQSLTHSGPVVRKGGRYEPVE